MDISILYRYTYVYSFKTIVINMENKTRLPYMEYISGHWW